MLSLDDVSFDTSTLTLDGDRNGVRVWWTPAGDLVSLHYFPVPPDIAADTSDLGKMWEFARSRRASTRAVQVSLETIDIQGCRLVRQIVKVPQEPSGMTYIGSVTAPFRDFSFVLKIEAKEEGMTGIRDNVSSAIPIPTKMTA